MAGIREYTNRIQEMAEDGMLDKDILIQDLLMWLSEHDVRAFYEANIEPAYDEDDEG
jgi:hypothetical protein